uniref:Uncharacterized protein n=1 Tax=Trichobilharzia regenti TaxID=157069 RepID=A0AA85JGW5_TRIRE|nr:unnamed protein product [Trichobilharzia regenti]
MQTRQVSYSNNDDNNDDGGGGFRNTKPVNKKNLTAVKKTNQSVTEAIRIKIVTRLCEYCVTGNVSRL